MARSHSSSSAASTSRLVISDNPAPQITPEGITSRFISEEIPQALDVLTKKGESNKESKEDGRVLRSPLSNSPIVSKFATTSPASERNNKNHLHSTELLENHLALLQDGTIERSSSEAVNNVPNQIKENPIEAEEAVSLERLKDPTPFLDEPTWVAKLRARLVVYLDAQKTSNHKTFEEMNIEPPIEYKHPEIFGAMFNRIATKNIVCYVCGRSQKRMDRAIHHWRKHVNVMPFSCDGACKKANCTATFASPEAAQAHVYRSTLPKVQCKNCDKELEKRNSRKHNCGKRKLDNDEDIETGSPRKRTKTSSDC